VKKYLKIQRIHSAVLCVKTFLLQSKYKKISLTKVTVDVASLSATYNFRNLKT